ncbi:MAG: FHA domain-containing protein [Planctomycetota bacterium]|jgi:pSer/pThr/pTyr-binding forkhead associated (FHA) protein
MPPEGKDMIHLLIGSAAKPIRLPMDRHFFIGRSQGNDIIIDDNRSSRRHCELYFDGSRFILLDLDSSNGTLVNDEEAHTAALNDGDIISIGFQNFTYRCVNSEAELSGTYRETQKRSQQMVTQILPSLDSQMPEGNDFNGTLATMGIADLCQFLNLSNRTGLLLVKGSKGRALVYFDKGNTTQAEYGTNLGDEAILELLKETAGHFTFKVDQKAIDPNMSTPLPTLLLEAAKRQDEQGL